ncbi:hypothetical protein C7M37_02906 (plasmid) [Lactiplantibacillus plantarum]|nr:hypothetical protein FET70_03363 [Lactiplantibacillus plantarum]QHM32437.1 hypothetical protein C7M34_03103 [Lactiplantibacillus plantarum]QHM35620.1 hypothetical protein C7M35_03041 [Lactiplantibacillus plantarum]QHM41845.1 hypothetical protein C7M37_02906 [Lactiplantibacillus plantarum]QHM64174.1 hypothetical protein C7M47_03139 [Lactiplantibacillus plantarum]
MVAIYLQSRVLNRLYRPVIKILVLMRLYFKTVLDAYIYPQIARTN